MRAVVHYADGITGLIEIPAYEAQDQLSVEIPSRLIIRAQGRGKVRIQLSRVLADEVPEYVEMESVV